MNTRVQGFLSKHLESIQRNPTAIDVASYFDPFSTKSPWLSHASRNISEIETNAIEIVTSIKKISQQCDSDERDIYYFFPIIDDYAFHCAMYISMYYMIKDYIGSEKATIEFFESPFVEEPQISQNIENSFEEPIAGLIHSIYKHSKEVCLIFEQFNSNGIHERQFFESILFHSLGVIEAWQRLALGFER